MQWVISNSNIHGCQRQEYILCTLHIQVYVREEAVYNAYITLLGWYYNHIQTFKGIWWRCWYFKYKLIRNNNETFSSCRTSFTKLFTPFKNLLEEILSSTWIINEAAFHAKSNRTIYITSMLFTIFSQWMAIYWTLLVLLSSIRQKGESQNGCYKKTKHAKFSKK